MDDMHHTYAYIFQQDWFWQVSWKVKSVTGQLPLGQLYRIMGVVALRGNCPQGNCPTGVMVLGGSCLGSNCPRGSCPMGVIVLWGSCLRGSCPQGSCPRGSCSRGSCPRTVKSHGHFWASAMIFYTWTMCFQRSQAHTIYVNQDVCYLHRGPGDWWWRGDNRVRAGYHHGPCRSPRTHIIPSEHGRALLVIGEGSMSRVHTGRWWTNTGACSIQS